MSFSYSSKQQALSGCMILTMLWLGATRPCKGQVEEPHARKRAAVRPHASSASALKIDVKPLGQPLDLQFLLVATNVSDEPIILDSQLVFLVSITVCDDQGRMLDETTVRAPGVEKEARVSLERFVEVPPGGVLRRKLDLLNGFVDFSYGMGLDGGGLHRLSSIGEITRTIRHPEKTRRIYFLYGASMGFHPAFKAYTGYRPSRVKLYEGNAIDCILSLQVSNNDTKWVPYSEMAEATSQEKEKGVKFDDSGRDKNSHQ